MPFQAPLLQRNPSTGTIAENGPSNPTYVALVPGAVIPPHLTTGVNPIGTVGDPAIPLFSTDDLGENTYRNLRIVNEGSAAGFYSYDGGTTWARIPADFVLLAENVTIAASFGAVEVKRAPGGTDLSGIYAEIW